MLQIHEDVFVLSLPTSGSSSKPLKYEAFGSEEEKENISSSQEAVNKQWGKFMYKATKETKMLNPLESLWRALCI